MNSTSKQPSSLFTSPQKIIIIKILSSKHRKVNTSYEFVPASQINCLLFGLLNQIGKNPIFTDDEKDELQENICKSHLEMAAELKIADITRLNFYLAHI